MRERAEEPYSYMLLDVPDRYKTEGICKEAVKEDPELLGYCAVRKWNPRDVGGSCREKSLCSGVCF